MNKLKKIFAVIILLVVFGGGSYAIYLAFTGTRQTDIKTVAEVDDKGVRLLYGDLGTDLDYLPDPAIIDYGIDQYPSSVASSQEELSFEGEINGSELTVGTFTTDDPVDSVTKYYIGKFGSNAKNGSIDSKENNFSYKYVTSTVDNAPVVIIYRQDDKTIIHLTKPGLAK